MNKLVLGKGIIIGFFVVFFTVMFVRFIIIYCTMCIGLVCDDNRKKAKTKRALHRLFSTSIDTQQSNLHKQKYIDNSDSCSICLVRLFCLFLFSSPTIE